MTTRLALVDDDQNILTSVSLMLEAEGYEVDTYFDSEQALSGLLRMLSNGRANGNTKARNL